MRSQARAASPFALLVALALGATACGGKKEANSPTTAIDRPANPQAVAMMARAAVLAKDPGSRGQAIELLVKAVETDPQLWEARFDLGVVRASAGDLAGAEPDLAKAEGMAPEEEDVAVALAEVRRRRGENKAAAEGLSRFVQAHPTALDARALFATSLRDAGQYDKAILEGREVLLRRPGDAAALADLALSYLAKGQRDTASLLAKQALTANPKSAAGARATGLIALAAGDDAVAFAAFSKATDADRTDTTAQLDMGIVLLRAGAYAKAAEHFRAVLAVVPDDTNAQVGLAAALRGQGDAKNPQMYEEARQILEKVLARDPHAVSALYNLGVLYADFLKKPEQAHALFQRFLDDAPADHPARGEATRYLASTKNGAPPPAPADAPAPPRSSEWRQVMSASERRQRLARKRVRRTLLFLALAGAICASTVGLAAPRKKAAAKPKADAAAASASSADASNGSGSTGAASSSATAAMADGGAEVKTSADGGAKVFRFGELEIEGRLKSPQLVYFLRRVRAEFSAGDLGHRSFFPELSQTKDDPNF